MTLCILIERRRSSAGYAAGFWDTFSFCAIISDRGKALFLDYGSASGNVFGKFNMTADTFGRMRFVEHTIDILGNPRGRNLGCILAEPVLGGILLLRAVLWLERGNRPCLL